MTFGINPEGFELKRFEDIQTELYAILEQIEDPETGETLDLSDENSPFSLVINALIDDDAKIWEALQDVYTQFDPSSAVQASLESLVQLNGITRQTGTFSTAPIDVTGDIGATIPAGQQISSGQDGAPVWITTADILLNGSGLGSGTVQAAEKGPTVALAGSLTTILTPVVGWDTVTNPLDAALGSNPETDAELRSRRDKSTETPSVAPVEAIFGNLSNLDGVEFARVFINNTLTTDSRGIPGKRIAAVVVGGDDQEIAETLFLRSPAGAGYFGNTTITLTDIQGEDYGIAFIRPDEIDIEVQVDLTVTDAGQFPSNGPDLIKEAIVVYAAEGAAGLGIEDGFEQSGFVPGEDVSVSRLFTPVNSVPGHTVDQLLVAKVGDTLLPNDIPISYDEVSRFNSVNITVNVST